MLEGLRLSHVVIPGVDARLSYRCPGCLQATSSDLHLVSQLKNRDEAWSVYYLSAVCVHDSCRYASLVQVDYGVDAPWEEFDFDEEHYRVTVNPPALRKYAPDGVPADLAEELTEALGCYESG